MKESTISRSITNLRIQLRQLEDDVEKYEQATLPRSKQLLRTVAFEQMASVSYSMLHMKEVIDRYISGHKK